MNAYMYDCIRVCMCVYLHVCIHVYIMYNFPDFQFKRFQMDEIVNLWLIIVQVCMNMTSYSSIFVELESTMTMSIPLAIILNEKAHYTKLSY